MNVRLKTLKFIYSKTLHQNLYLQLEIFLIKSGRDEKETKLKKKKRENFAYIKKEKCLEIEGKILMK